MILTRPLKLVLVLMLVGSCAAPQTTQSPSLPEPLEATPDSITFSSPTEPRMFDGKGAVASQHCEALGRMAVFEAYDSINQTATFRCEEI